MTSALLEFLETHEEAFRSRSRLASLYSDFRSQRSTNPDGYQANSAAWLRGLAAAARAGVIPPPSGSGAGGNDRLVLDCGEELLRALQTKLYGRPLALGAVLEDAVQRNKLVPLNRFLQMSTNVYHVDQPSWIPSLSSVMRWGLDRLGVLGDGSGDEAKLAKGEFVWVENVDDAAKAVLVEAEKMATTESTRVYSTSLFNKTFAPVLSVESLSRSDLRVLLRHLQRDHSAIVYDAASGVVKFKSALEVQPSPITPEDETVARVRTLISTRQTQIEQLTGRISQLDLQARSAVANKQLIGAKMALRQKKAASGEVEKLHTNLALLENTYAQIEQAAGQVELVKVMQEAGQVLKTLNKQTGGVDKVQETVDDLREEMETVDQIGQAITEDSLARVDEGEVEEELESLEKVEKEKQELAERKKNETREATKTEESERKEVERTEWTRQLLADLPSVPQTEHEKQQKQQQQEKEDRVEA